MRYVSITILRREECSANVMIGTACAPEGIVVVRGCLGSGWRVDVVLSAWDGGAAVCALGEAILQSHNCFSALLLSHCASTCIGDVSNDM